MSVMALIGGQWGEEGKGKFTEILAEQAKVVVRYSGGGHIRQPVINEQGRFNLQFIPRSIFNNKVITILGAGMVLDPKRVVEEMEALVGNGINLKRLFISEQAHLIMPYHPLFEEQERRVYGTPIIDTLGSGLGPAYADKVSRIGIRVGDLIQEEQFLSRLSKTLTVKNDILTKVYKQEPLNLREIYQQYLSYGRAMRERIFDTRLILQKAIEDNHTIILESDQGSMLDLDFGSYPYVSNASPTVGAACIGCGLPPSVIKASLGVFSAYIIRSQTGPFPTEMSKEEGAPLVSFRSQDNSRGGRRATNPITGERYRRYGWFDTVAARFVAQLNGLTSLAITNLDALDDFKIVKICTEYQVYDTNVRRFPSDIGTLKIATPVYEELPGWEAPTAHIKSFDELPANCQNFIKRIGTLVGVNVDIVSTGPDQKDTIVMRDPLRPINMSRVMGNYG
ncbi:MAG: adenylosuccinate synthase [Chloroflexi bacterium]|uniref:Adenylosuccinate synthetase n=1 Tax=Candidatus Chlorohelix allophototropha TaxID=3003348 RepID=A0A8T7M813_9CHLR|nr:adenylosuccinate synthase [Chloroflexota bacterium]WJW68103.1 adenylosuccinate synthase [Chloroflexota bacterium L227-S17]